MTRTSLDVEISGIHMEISDTTRTYIEKKVAKMIDFIPRKMREAAFASVKIEQIQQRSSDDKFEVTIVLTLPEKKLVAKEIAPSPLAAVDLAETKLRGQVRRYKTEHRKDGVRTGGIFAKIKRSLRRRK